jgi:hypothetical protein
LRHVSGHTATLNHEIGNNAVKNCVRKKTVRGVLAEVLTGYWCCLFEELDDDVAMAG